jgi:hypothetical protein
MLLSAVLVILIGFVLGLFFKVPAFIAASFIVLISTAVAARYQHWSLVTGILSGAVFLCLLQVSYLLGLRSAHIVRQLPRCCIP